MWKDSAAVDDLERLSMTRSWPQRAWASVPPWAKIGLRALLVLLLIHVALGIRIWYGLQDPPEVADFGGPGRHIIIPATNRDFRNPLNWLDAMPVGLRGTRASDVTDVRLDEHTTDELVAYIAKHFPKVQSLYFSRGNITSEGLLVLKACPEISSLDVSDTDIDDGLGDLLPHLPKLTTLIAMNTDLGVASPRPRRNIRASHTVPSTGRTSHPRLWRPGNRPGRTFGFRRILIVSLFAE